MQSGSPRGRWLIVLAVLFALAWFGTLDQRKLVKPDEGRYAEIAREMAVSGDWVTPRLNGIKYFEKPPLQYWATAAAYEAFGQHEWTARLWPALTGFLGVLLSFYTGQRLFGREAGILAAAELGSSFFWVGMGHFNSLDMGLSFFLQLALFGFLIAQHAPPGQQSQRNWMLLAWAAAALAVLSKGLIALVLPGASLVLYSVLTRDWQPWRRLHPVGGVAVFLAIAAPWFIAVALRNPEFLRFFFIHEHFERFLTPVHRRVEPWWYFVPVLLVAALPWSFLAIHAGVAQWRAADAPQRRALRMLVIWSLFTLFFFSLSSSKLPSYILPILPAAALLAGRYAAVITPRTLGLHLVPALLLAALLLAVAPRLADHASVETPAAMLLDYRPYLHAAGAMLLTAALLALALRRRPGSALLMLAAGAFFAFTTALLGHETLSRSSSSWHIAQEVRPILKPETPFYAVRTYDQTLPFYLGRTMTLVDFADEMAFGLEQEPALAIPTLEAFVTRWESDGEALALTSHEGFDELLALNLPMEIVARDTRRVIVRKSAPP